MFLVGTQAEEVRPHERTPSMAGVVSGWSTAPRAALVSNIGQLEQQGAQEDEQMPYHMGSGRDQSSISRGSVFSAKSYAEDDAGHGIPSQGHLVAKRVRSWFWYRCDGAYAR